MTSIDRITHAPWGAIATFLPVVLAALPASAAESPDAYRLGETILVLGERPRIADEVATVDTVTADEIARRGARTLDEAIALLPGVYVRNGADGVPRVDIRGMRTRNIVLLKDGVPLNSGYDGQFDPAAIPAGNIAVIKVTRGASSVLYGPGGNAGVIEIITKAAGETLRAGVGGEYEFSEAYELRGSVSGRVGGAGVSLWGSVFDRDHFELSDDFRSTALQPGDERVNSDREQSALQGNLVFDAGGADIGLSLAYRDGEYGKPPTTVSNTESVYANRPRYERVDFDALSLRQPAAQRRFPGGCDDRGRRCRRAGVLPLRQCRAAVGVRERAAGELGIGRVHRDDHHRRWRRWRRWWRWWRWWRRARLP